MEDKKIDINEYFNSWSDKINVPVEEFKEEYNKYSEKLKEAMPDLTENQVIKKGLFYVRGLYQRHFQSKAKTFEGVIIGYGDIYDPYRKERKQALENDEVDEEGEPVFFNENPALSWRKGRKIPSPESNESAQRLMYGVFKQENESDWRLGIFYYTGKDNNENKLPELYTKYKVRAGCSDKKINEPILYLNTASVTRFEKTEQEKINFEKMAEELFEKNLCALKDIEEFDTSEVPFGLMVTKGIVVSVNITKDTTASGAKMKSNAIEITETDTGEQNLDDLMDIDSDGEGNGNITFWVSKDQPLNFGVGSEVVIVSQKYTRDSNEEDKDTVTSYTAVGIYPKFSTSPEEKPSKIEETEKTTDASQEKEITEEPKEKQREENGDEEW